MIGQAGQWRASRVTSRNRAGIFLSNGDRVTSTLGGDESTFSCAYFIRRQQGERTCGGRKHK